MPINLPKIHAVETDQSIKTRLEGASEAQKRSRLVLGFMAIACTSMCIASYNAYLSFNRSAALDIMAANPKDLDKRDDHGDYAAIDVREFSNSKGPDVLTQHGLSSWADSRNVSISLLGIRVSIDDAPIIGTATLFVISIWFLLSTRRENHTICYLLNDTQLVEGHQVDIAMLKRQWDVFHGIVTKSVFSTYSKLLKPIGLGEMFVREEETQEKKAGRGQGRWESVQAVFLSGLVWLLLWLPVITSLFMFVLDRFSFIQRSPFRPGLKGIPHTELMNWFWSVTWVWFLVLWILLVITTSLSVWYNYTTEKAVREYLRRLIVSLNREEVQEEVIRERAYYLAKLKGFPPGREKDFWHQAEDEVKSASKKLGQEGFPLPRSGGDLPVSLGECQSTLEGYALEAKDQQTLLIAVYKENADQARHHEQLRERITTIVAQTTGVVLGLLSISKAGQVHSQPVYAFIAGFLVVLGLLGFVICWKHNERARLHRERIRQVRQRLIQVSGVGLRQINEDADTEHEKDYPNPEFIRLDWAWKSFHILVALLGVTLFIVWVVSLTA